MRQSLTAGPRERDAAAVSAQARSRLGLEDLLWSYLLKEAEARGAGNQLGPVGGRIVAEVPLGLLRADGPPDLAAPEAFGGDRHLFLAKRRRVRRGPAR